MQLNNLLQSNGGAGRLRWGEATRGGPEHHPNWTISAFRQSPKRPVYSHLTSAYSRRYGVRQRHWGNLGRGQGGSRSPSPEADPCAQLRTLVDRAKR